MKESACTSVCVFVSPLATANRCVLQLKVKKSPPTDMQARAPLNPDRPEYSDSWRTATDKPVTHTQSQKEKKICVHQWDPAARRWDHLKCRFAPFFKIIIICMQYYISPCGGAGHKPLCSTCKLMRKYLIFTSAQIKGRWRIWVAAQRITCWKFCDVKEFQQCDDHFRNSCWLHICIQTVMEKLPRCSCPFCKLKERQDFYAHSVLAMKVSPSDAAAGFWCRWASWWLFLHLWGGGGVVCTLTQIELSADIFPSWPPAPTALCLSVHSWQKILQTQCCQREHGVQLQRPIYFTLIKREAKDWPEIL